MPDKPVSKYLGFGRRRCLVFSVDQDGLIEMLRKAVTSQRAGDSFWAARLLLMRVVVVFAIRASIALLFRRDVDRVVLLARWLCLVRLDDAHLQVDMLCGNTKRCIFQGFLTSLPPLSLAFSLLSGWLICHTTRWQSNRKTRGGRDLGK